MRLLTICLIAICGVVSAAPAPKDKTTGQKLVGKWQLVKSDQPLPEAVTYFIEFTKDGKLSLTIVPKNKDAVSTAMKGTYKLDDEKIDYTLELANGGQKTEILTIKKLTETDLVTTDPDNIKEEFERVKAEEKGEKKTKE
jgi:uncharacterized protein (TIGR03066 family)